MRTDWLKEFRTSCIELITGFSMLILFDVKPTWELVSVLACLYVVLVVLGAVVAVVSEARSGR